MTDYPLPPPPPAPNLQGSRAVPIPEVPENKGPGRPRMYPWDEWLDGERAWTLVPGTHFTCTLTSFLVQVHRAARKRGMVAVYDYDKSVPRDEVEEVTIWAEEGE